MLGREVLKCPVCNEFLRPPAAPLPSHIRARLEEHLRSAEPLKQTVPFRVSLRTMIVLGVAALAGAGAVWVRPLAAPAVPVALVGLGLLVLDLSVPVKRRTPEDAVRQLMGGLRGKLYDRAYLALSPLAKEDVRAAVPDVPELEVRPIECSFETPEGFRKYWRTLAGCDLDLVRWLGFRIRQTRRISDRVAAVRVEVVIRGVPLWVLILTPILPVSIPLFLLTRKTATFLTDKVVYEHSGAWWVLCGELSSPMDDAFA